jgi:DNA helicase-2/ATP-dependent DNA helicase PcrA
VATEQRGKAKSRAPSLNVFRPRKSQQAVLEYSGGKMGVLAVPGSGKTHTLAALAARLVQEEIEDDQEVLIVTLVNSAVENFKLRINHLLARSERHLLPGYGYRVRTLHGLAHDVVRERPGLVGLSEDFGIIDERQASAVHRDAVESWLRANPGMANAYLSRDLEGNQAEWILQNRWPPLVAEVAAAFVKRAKDLQLTPAVLLSRLAEHPDDSRLALARMCSEIYADYQRSLAYRGVVDFDDLIRLGLDALERDPDYLARLQQRWPFVLEDEAQDSSRLQQEILGRLSRAGGNWVRVGDPNQAIYQTFTTADPKLLIEFVGQDGEGTLRELPESGRSQPAIIDLANHLIDWVRESHPTEAVRKALTPPYVEPTGPGDPQPNPPADPGGIRLVDRELTPQQELQFVSESLARWLREQEALPEQERQTCAVLAPRNRRGTEVVQLLRHLDVPYVELLRSTNITRQTAGALGNLLRALADPISAKKLDTAFRVWRRDDRDQDEEAERVKRVARRIRGCPAVEAYLWPRADHDWLAQLDGELAEDERELLEAFQPVARRWHRAAALPIDQLILTLAADLFQEPSELALAHKLALLLRDVAETHPAYRLTELVEELGVIARNERRFLGFDVEDGGFEPPPGVVTVATMHKAKGLEWDRVYLMSVNNYNFPSGLPHDQYLSERWFIRGQLNLEAEALAQLQALASSAPDHRQPAPEPGEATSEAREEYVAERLRLLYVGITRARRELYMTWNTGPRRDKLQPAVPLMALLDYLHKRQQEGSDADA